MKSVYQLGMFKGAKILEKLSTGKYDLYKKNHDKTYGFFWEKLDDFSIEDIVDNYKEYKLERKEKHKTNNVDNKWVYHLSVVLLFIMTIINVKVIIEYILSNNYSIFTQWLISVIVIVSLFELSLALYIFYKKIFTLEKKRVKMSI